MKFCLRLSMIAAATFVGVSQLSAQRTFRIKADVGSEVDSMIFGDRINATYGLDPTLGELDGPPAPGPDGGWAAWVDPRGNCYKWAGDTVSHPYLYLKDLRPYYDYGQVDSFQLNVIPYTGTHVVLTWPDSAYLIARCDRIFMTDRISGGLIVNVNMMHQDTLTIPEIYINDLLIVVGSPPVAVRRTNSAIPTSFALHQNYPNPFNPGTVIRYELLNATHVTLQVYNAFGQEMATLVDRMEEPGFKSVEFDGRSENGSMLPSGVYFYRIQAEGFSAARKMLLLR